ncbi:hypothetical protein MOX02_45930 [Methylobacterium oxalidis]|uniref:Uncharacterized protein n=1 Tax=Methylobacterium oxalidis TaxID=944322 RepID=A0A512J9H2_9HYPH|nr:hypothetical protein MOX02_45930 [Methylobacterium oxalidis]GLS63867.1 hypothetical protein GCM10007888_22480 [Methylobacterium oxalidis]
MKTIGRGIAPAVMDGLRLPVASPSLAPAHRPDGTSSQDPFAVAVKPSAARVIGYVNLTQVNPKLGMTDAASPREETPCATAAHVARSIRM